jgi:hypothetical protein
MLLTIQRSRVFRGFTVCKNDNLEGGSRQNVAVSLDNMFLRNRSAANICATIRLRNNFLQIIFFSKRESGNNRLNFLS